MSFLLVVLVIAMTLFLLGVVGVTLVMGNATKTTAAPRNVGVASAVRGADSAASTIAGPITILECHLQDHPASPLLSHQDSP